MKPTLNTYISWFRDKFEIDLESKPANIYEFISAKIQNDVEGGAFWTELNNNIENFNDEYYIQHSYPLLRKDHIKLQKKTYISLIDKSFRKNILLNENFPDPPGHGWLTPENWYSLVKDLLRTTITVRYLDGVKFISEKINQLAIKHNVQFEVDFEAREEGYYAAHITLRMKLNIVDSQWNEKEINFPIEIQVTTQLQEVIKGLLHKMYEDTRITEKADEHHKWQWDYKSLEFSSNYLGHILHYVEGMILEVRDKQKNKTKTHETGF